MSIDFSLGSDAYDYIQSLFYCFTDELVIGEELDPVINDLQQKGYTDFFLQFEKGRRITLSDVQSFIDWREECRNAKYRGQRPHPWRKMGNLD
jgi:hypothetical protein